MVFVALHVVLLGCESLVFDPATHFQDGDTVQGAVSRFCQENGIGSDDVQQELVQQLEALGFGDQGGRATTPPPSSEYKRDDDSVVVNIDDGAGGDSIPLVFYFQDDPNAVAESFCIEHHCPDGVQANIAVALRQLVMERSDVDVPQYPPYIEYLSQLHSRVGDTFWHQFKNGTFDQPLFIVLNLDRSPERLSRFQAQFTPLAQASGTSTAVAARLAGMRRYP